MVVASSACAVLFKNTDLTRLCRSVRCTCNAHDEHALALAYNDAAASLCVSVFLPRRGASEKNHVLCASINV